MPNRPISPVVHGVLDYTTAAALLAAPKALGLGGTPAGAVLRAAGAGTVGYSLLTEYELGVVKVVPYRVHLAIDAVSAMGLLAAPWIAGRRRTRSRWPFGARRTSRAQWLPHVAFGLWELAAVALSEGRAGADVESPAPSAPNTGTAPSSAAAAASATAAGGDDSPAIDPGATVMPEGAEAALEARGAAARRGAGGGGVGSGTGSDPQVGGLQT